MLVVRGLRPGSYGTATYGDLTLALVDVRRPAQRNLPALREVVTDALKRLSVAGQGFGELVTSHLHRVIAMPSEQMSKGSETIWSQRAYLSAFDGLKSTDGQYLACLLIRAATIARLMRDARSSGATITADDVERISWQAQKRFLERFDNAETWIIQMRPASMND